MDGLRHLVFQPLAADIEAWSARGWCASGLGPAASARVVLRNAGLRATLLHRLGYWAVRRRVPGLPTLLQALNLVLHGIELAPSVPVGPGLYLAHTTGTVIHARSIGARVELQGGVTIGQRREDDFPTIKDGVRIGAGARVLGPITLHQGARVGANAVVTRDVAAGVTVVGVPAAPITPAITPASAAPTPATSASVAGREVA